jgi:hypothetical protein
VGAASSASSFLSIDRLPISFQDLRRARTANCSAPIPAKASLILSNSTIWIVASIFFTGLAVSLDAEARSTSGGVAGARARDVVREFVVDAGRATRQSYAGVCSGGADFVAQIVTRGRSHPTQAAGRLFLRQKLPRHED